MRIDAVRDLAEVTPFLMEFRRFMSRLQQIATFPLYVIDDPSWSRPVSRSAFRAAFGASPQLTPIAISRMIRKEK